MEIDQQDSRTISLTNDGRLSLFFVGCGSAFSKTMDQNNLLIVKGDQHLLIDCGTKTPQALYDHGISVGELQNFLITHTHADHIGGLEEVMMTHRYLNGSSRPNIIINEEFEAILWNHSLRGGSAYSETRDGLPLTFTDFWNPLRPALLDSAPRETWAIETGGLSIKMPRTKHFPDNAESWKDSFWSCGLIIDDRILFTSDTRFDPELIKSYDDQFNFEIIFHDCQFFTGGVHASLEELSTLPERIKQKMILMHYSDNWREFEQQALDAGFHSFAQQYHTYHFY